MKKYFAILIILLAGISLLAADDQTQAKQFLRWLPDTSFSNIHFSDLTAGKDHEFYNAYQKVHTGRHQSGISDSLLPDSMKDSVSAFCTATFSDVELKKKSSGKVKLVNSGDKVFIISMADPQTLINAVLEKKAMTRAGFRLFKKPVFSVTSGSDKKRKEGFLWIAPDNTVITTTSKEALKLLAKTGAGSGPSFLDNAENGRVVSMASQMGPRWSLRYVASEKQKRIDTLVSEGEDFEKVEALEESMEEEMLFEFSDVRFLENISVRKFMVYPDADTAEKKKKEYEKGIQDAGVDISKSIAEHKNPEKNKNDSPLEKKLNVTVNKFVLLTLNDVKDTLGSQKIRREDDTVITENAYKEQHFVRRQEAKEARKAMDAQIKKIIAQAKANGDIQ